MSKLEYKVEKYLIEKGVKYIPQYKFDDCINKRSLPFDFYLPNNNVLIEVNGAQHYYEDKFFNGMGLEERKRIDKIKKDYCIQNGYKFLEIPFWDIESKISTYKRKIDDILG